VSATDPDARRAELATNLAALRVRVAAACRTAGRSPQEVTVVAVTKTFPSSDIRHLAGLGVRDIGENRDQDAAGKAAECADLPLTWHFVGQLQTNKASSVASYADVVHSVDRGRLVRALDKGAAAAGRTLRCLVQVDLQGGGGSADRGGTPPREVRALADEVAKAPHLELGGVMAVSPLGADPDAPFALLAEIAADLRAAYPDATAVSAGMTGDLEAAIAHGATHLRVGSAILGSRPPLG
jgi:pyridoxal phosphate enzyme (YggS family)